METDAIIGICVIAAALGLTAWLVLRSARGIDRIARRGYDTARAIEKDGHGV
jgi:hypothetical protein